MDLTYAGYILFVIPGFTLVWTYRHFTKATKIGEFEYAAWSFLWGVILFLTTGTLLKFQNSILPSVPLNDIGAVIGSLLGISLGTAMSLSFPLGLVGVVIARLGFFDWIDKKLFKLLSVFNRD
jgi:hypothetical protein